MGILSSHPDVVCPSRLPFRGSVLNVYLRNNLFTARGETCPTVGGDLLSGRPGLLYGTASGGPRVNEGRDARGRGAHPALPLLPDPAVLRPLTTFLIAFWPLDIPCLTFPSSKILSSTYQLSPREPVFGAIRLFLLESFSKERKRAGIVRLLYSVGCLP